MLKFENVSFKYPNVDDYALKNINFEINRGEWLTILGNNGSGKSTITKLMCAQYEKTSGEIYIDGKEYNQENIEYIQNRIAVVFQNPDNQFVGSTVEEDIAFGLENKNVQPEKMIDIIDEVLEIVDMTEFKYNEPRDLSGGQKQRVAIASALALEPKILILDEATSMLDPVARETILNYIKKINRENNVTIVSITHDVEELKYSDNILLINNGTVIIKSNSQEIFNDKQLLEKYDLEIPFLDKVKEDLNKRLDGKIFFETDSLEVTTEKLCKLILKK